jgi:hypothetical protein
MDAPRRKMKSTKSCLRPRTIMAPAMSWEVLSARPTSTIRRGGCFVVDVHAPHA